MRWLLLVVLMVGCARPLPQPIAQRAEPAIAIPRLPAWHLACSGAPDRSVRRTIYDFMPVPLLPVARGPRVAEQSRAGYARTDVQLDELLRREHAAISGCWKWASARGAPATSIDLAVMVATDGTSRGLELSGVGAGTRELERCLRDNLEGMAVGDRSPRETRFHARLAFVRADQPPWPAPPVRPLPVTRAARAHACGPVLEGVPADVVVERRPFVVEDRDPAREPHKPSVSVGCVSVRPMTSKVLIRAAFAANRGAFQACYAAARDRAGLGPDEPGGEVKLALRFGPGGVARAVAVSGAGDAALHACLQAAARDVWLPSTDGGVEVNLPFELRPPPPPAVSPEDLLAADDLDGALAAWKRDARTATGRAECVARANIVRAHAARAPWLDDERLFAALAEVGRAADALAPWEATACIEPIAGLAKELAFSDLHRNHRWNIVARTGAVMPLARGLRWGDELRWRHAEALLHSPRRSEGIAALRAMGDDRALSLLAELQAPIPLERGCH